MADPTEQKVDAAIAKVQAALDDLKAAQKGDEAADTAEDEQPKTLKEADAETRRRFAQARDSAKKQN